MRIFLLLPLFLLLLASCKSDTTNTTTTTTTQAAPSELGKKLTADAVTPLPDLIKRLEDSTTVFEDVQIDGGNMVSGLKNSKIEGVVNEVCQTSGCWLDIKADNKIITVLVKDKQFKLPKDLSGKTVIVQGNAYKAVTTVEELRQIAKSNGTPSEKIAEINSPTVEFFLSAEGIIIK
jgi:hypothetical protein